MSIFKPNASGKVLLNPISLNPDFQITPLTGLCLQTVERTRFYSIIWIKQGQGVVSYEFNDHSFQASSILFFAPYQPFTFKEGTSASGVSLHFSSDFYCIERHRQEVSCSGVLFNNVYESPLIQITDEQGNDLDGIIQNLRMEFDNNPQPDPQLVLSFLKIFLIKATRIKQSQSHILRPSMREPANQKLRLLRKYIEIHFRTHKRPSDYAAMLHISSKALGKMAKQHFNKTLTRLIQERVVVEAKRELSLTEKSIKEIADELGYDDPFYFSRVFKKISTVSPELYRLSYRLR